MSFPADSRLVDAVRPAVNCEPRRGGLTPTILLLHYTGMRSAARAVEWLACAESGVSCHYVVDDAGQITQLVPESLRAWHAGASYWAGERDINSASIGIEVHNPGHEMGYPDFPRGQMDALEALCRDIVDRRRICPGRVLAHSDVAPSRKIDPGEKFPWDRLARAGIGHWVEPSPLHDDRRVGSDPWRCDRDHGADAGARGLTPSSQIGEAQELLARYGYEITETGVLDEQTRLVLRAFQLHFRPARVDGRLDGSTLDTLKRLVGMLPGVSLCHSEGEAAN